MWDITIQAQEVNNTPQAFRAKKYSSCKLQARAQMAVSAEDPSEIEKHGKLCIFC
jgi:hypothetical protein